MLRRQSVQLQSHALPRYRAREGVDGSVQMWLGWFEIPGRRGRVQRSRIAAEGLRTTAKVYASRLTPHLALQAVSGTCTVHVWYM